MNLDLKRYNLATAITIFIALPLLFYSLGDVPKRSVLKESLSVLTLLSFCLMLSQFYLSRGNANVLNHFRLKQIMQAHKVIAYFVLFVFLVHPFMIVLPRYFEAGVSPIDALTSILTAFDTPGIVLGMIAWSLLLILGVSAMYRFRLIKRLGIKYIHWRKFHGYLTVTFAFVAVWHAIELGRHIDIFISALIILLAGGGAALLFKMYWSAAKRPRKRLQ